jgi:hypothetical protein
VRRLHNAAHQLGNLPSSRVERMVCNGVRRIETAVALALCEVKGDAPLLRIPSQYLTGDALGSLCATVAIS